MGKVSREDAEQFVFDIIPCALCANIIPEQGEKYCPDCKSYVEDIDNGMFSDWED